MAVGVKTTGIVQYRFPNTVLLMLFSVVVLSFLEEYIALFLFQINSIVVLSLEKQMNWAFKRVFSGF